MVSLSIAHLLNIQRTLEKERLLSMGITLDKCDVCSFEEMV